MKIAIACYNLSWQAGGTRLVFSLARAFEKLGHIVVIYTPEFNPEAYPDLHKDLDIREIKLPQPLLWRYESGNLFDRMRQKRQQDRLRKLAGKKIAKAMDADFDLVNPHDFSYPVGYFYRKRNPRAKIIWTMNDPPFSYLPKANKFYDFLSRLYNWYMNEGEKKYWSVANAVVVWNNLNKAWVEAGKMKAGILWNCADVDGFYSPVKNTGGRRSFVLLGIGVLNKYRRFEDIILAVKRLRELQYDAKTVIVCKNIWQEDEYQEQLREFTRANGLAEHVRLLFDGVSEEGLKEIYRQADIFVLPIHAPPPRNGFTFQLVIFEAMAAGLPLIMSRRNDAAEVLTDGVNVMLVDPQNPEQIAAKAKMLMDDPTLYKAVATAGQEFTKANVSWEKYAKGMLALL